MPKQELLQGDSLGYFVGREQELKVLNDALEIAISQNDCWLVLIQGDYGVGKTALVQYFIHSMKRKNRSLLIGRGKCSMETDANGLVPFSNALTELVRTGSQKHAAKELAINKNLWDFTKKVAPAWLDIVTAGFAGAISTTIEEGAKLVKPSQAKFNQESIFTQFANALIHLGRKHPIILFIDDIHWSDKTSLQLLFHLVRNLENQAILIIATYRPVEAFESSPNAKWFRDELRPNLLREQNVIEVTLEAGIKIPEYIQKRYPNNEFPPNLADLINKKTDGHALFVEQLFSLWEETGTIVCLHFQNGSAIWKFSKEAKDIPEIPHVVSEILDARVRLLSKQLQEILIHASVEGEDFVVQVIASILQIDELKALDDVASLESKYRLVFSIGSEKTDSKIYFDFYRFAHRFIREHIYWRLNDGQRRILHNQVGLAMEKLYSRPERIAGELSRHFYEAKEYSKAVKYAMKAAQYEMSRYSWAEASAWCKFGAGFLGFLPEEADTKTLRFNFLNLLALSSYNIGDYQLAVHFFREILEEFDYLHLEPTIWVDVCENLADSLEELGEYEEGLKIIERAKMNLTTINAASGENVLRLETLEGLFLCRLGKTEKAIDILQRIMSELRSIPPTSSSIVSLGETAHIFAIVLGYVNRYSESIPMYHIAIKAAERSGDITQKSHILSNLATDYILVGKLKEAEDVCTQAIELSRQIGNRSDEAWALNVRGETYLHLRHFKKSLADLTLAEKLLTDSGGWILGYTHTILSLTLLALPEIDKAYFHAIQGLKFSGSDKYFKAYAYDAMGQVEGKRKKYNSSTSAFKTAVKLFTEVGARHLAGKSQQHWAEMLIIKGDFTEALNLLHTAQQTFQKLKLTKDADIVSQLIDQLVIQRKVGGKQNK